MIEYWFPTPVFCHDFTGSILKRIQDEIHINLDYITKDKKNSPWGDTVKTTFDNNLVNDVETYQLLELKNALFWAVDQYVTEIKYPEADFQLIESWFNFCEKNGFQYDHTHPRCRISGVYYYQTNTEDGKLRFENPNPIMQFNGFPSDRLPISSVNYTPKIGRMVLFPSWLTHRVNVNYTNHERISITFNLL